MTQISRREKRVREADWSKYSLQFWSPTCQAEKMLHLVCTLANQGVNKIHAFLLFSLIVTLRSVASRLWHLTRRSRLRRSLFAIRSPIFQSFSQLLRSSLSRTMLSPRGRDSLGCFSLSAHFGGDRKGRREVKALGSLVTICSSACQAALILALQTKLVVQLPSPATTVHLASLPLVGPFRSHWPLTVQC